MQKLRKISILCCLIFLISGCSIKFSDRCDNIDFASIMYADKVEILGRLGVSMNDVRIVNDPRQLKLLSYKLLAIQKDWEPIFGTAAGGDYSLFFNKNNKRTHRIFVNTTGFNDGFCYKIFDKTPNSGNLYTIISDLFNNAQSVQ